MECPALKAVAAARTICASAAAAGLPAFWIHSCRPAKAAEGYRLGCHLDLSGCTLRLLSTVGVRIRQII